MPNGERDLAYLFLTTALPGERLAELAILTLAQTGEVIWPAVPSW